MMKKIDKLPLSALFIGPLAEQRPLPNRRKGRHHRVGVNCAQGAYCRHREMCREIYNQDLLNDKGDCSQFQPWEPLYPVDKAASHGG
ncbi:MAG: hypothetical protein HQL52_02475 [Magnetococcales bacterium]|nr:hypothetical protein [Magnetococcales bacterium]